MGSGRPGPAPVVYTVGYEGRDPGELVDLLRRHGVRLLVDVRLNAVSRRRGFSTTALASVLAGGGIGYRHERTLGNPRDNRDAFRAGEAAALERYRHHLAGGGAEVLDRLCRDVRTTAVALLCLERDPRRCHRTVVADALGARVVEL